MENAQKSSIDNLRNGSVKIVQNSSKENTLKSISTEIDLDSIQNDLETKSDLECIQNNLETKQDLEDIQNDLESKNDLLKCQNNNINTPNSTSNIINTGNKTNVDHSILTNDITPYTSRLGNYFIFNLLLLRS